ncbi:Uma2 family endonuclease [Oscillatoria sp. CS-180]|uniref:Uma2 family endonuclease n=1 Tax=Oscillatoria sp. CS-180 TaxID=3021720 RepID=UPI00232CFDCD|nr:Uma2 family endonuclease [Oscillatoria sp. CS-180]MDB9524667.1 Uma2 family endonuclease [Oscillatoria sp. CS-180]
MTSQFSTALHYPESDGQPMTESDPTRDYLTYCVEALKLFFQSRSQVYVSGNLFIYYEEGNPRKVVSPDVFVVFGVIKRQRRVYKTWEEGGKVPAFVLEITSRTTRRQDEDSKPQLYAQLGVQEYFQYDPTGDYLVPQLKGFTLVDGSYVPIPLAEKPDGKLMIHSAALDLDFCLPPPDSTALTVVAQGQIPRPLRLFDPKTGEKLTNYAESVEARNQERDRAEQAEQAQRAAVPKLAALGLSSEQIADTLGLTIEAVEQLLPTE